MASTEGGGHSVFNTSDRGLSRACIPADQDLGETLSARRTSAVAGFSSQRWQFTRLRALGRKRQAQDDSPGLCSARLSFGAGAQRVAWSC